MTLQRGPWLVFSVTSIGIVAASFQTSMVAIALPDIASDLELSAGEANWVVLSYFVVTPVLILVFGRLSDVASRRRVYLAGFAVLAAASAICTFAGDGAWLIGGRIAQAVGSASVLTNSTALLLDVFPRATLGRALGYNVAVAAVSNAVGPVLGGALSHFAGWRLTFAIIVPLSIAGLVWGAIAIPERPPASPDRRVGVPSAIVLFLGLSSLLYAISEGSRTGWASPVILGLLVVGAAGCVIFVVMQARLRVPLLDLTVLRNRARALGYSSNFFMSMGRVVVVVLVSLFVQAARGGNALDAGLATIPLAAGLTIGSVVVGQLTQRASARLLSTAGATLSAAGFLVLTLFIEGSPIAVGVGLALVGLGNGVFMTPNTSEMLSTVEPSLRGAANGLRSMLQYTAQAISTAACLAIATAGLTVAGQQAVFSGNLPALGPAELGAFTVGCQLALLVLLAVSAVAAVLSALRGAVRG